MELIPFQPVDGADTRYGQLYNPISAHPFKEAGIKGFAPIQPYKVTSILAITTRCAAFHCPSLSELNDEFARSLGIMMTNFNDISTGILLPSSLCCLWDRLPRVLLILFLRLQPFTFLRPPSLTVWIDCSLSPTVLGPIHLGNGGLRELLSATQCRCTHLVCLMVNLFLSFISAIPQIGATMQSTSAIGFSTMDRMTLNVQLCHRRLI